MDRISKIWIMKKFDIQSIQVSMYPKKTDIHVSKYPCIQVCMISKYPIIQVSKKNQYPRYPCIQIYEKSGIHSSLERSDSIKRNYRSFTFNHIRLIKTRPHRDLLDLSLVCLANQNTELRGVRQRGDQMVVLLV